MNILVTDPLSPAGISLLRAAGHSVDEKLRQTPAAIQSIVGNYEVMLVRSGTIVTAEMIAKMDRMKIIGRAGAGVDNIDVEAATRRGIIVMNTPGGNTRSAAEHTIGMLFALARHIPAADAQLRGGTWNRKDWMGFELKGKVLGVIGFGRIGFEVSSIAKGIGMSVCAFDPVVPASEITALGATALSMDELLASAAVLTIHVPLLSSTRNMIGDAQFTRCTPGVRLVNCSRGGIVDEAALLRALDSGIVAGAALDVFTQEPPPTDHPLLHHPRVVVTPHIGAATVEAQERVAVDIARQVVAALAGGPIVGAVNKP